MKTKETCKFYGILKGFSVETYYLVFNGEKKKNCKANFRGHFFYPDRQNNCKKEIRKYIKILKKHGYTKRVKFLKIFCKKAQSIPVKFT